MAGCCFVFTLIAKPMLTFWVGKAEMIDVRCHMPATRL